METYTKIKKIGDGSYSRVYTCKNSSKTNVVVCKRNIADKDVDSLFSLRELDLLSTMIHKNIIKLINIYHGKISVENGFSPIQEKKYRDDNLHFIMEKMEMDLEDFIYQSKECYKINIITDITKSIIEGLSYLHRNNVIHRDLKLSNILVSKVVNNNIQVKICDFGLSKRWVDQNDQHTPDVCTICFCAPEVLLLNQQSYKMDIWGLGCILFRLLTKEFIFSTKINNKIAMVKNIGKNVNNFKDIKKFDIPYQDAWNILDVCITHDSNKRNILKVDNVYKNELFEIKEIIHKCLVILPEERIDIFGCEKILFQKEYIGNNEDILDEKITYPKTLIKYLPKILKFIINLQKNHRKEKCIFHFLDTIFRMENIIWEDKKLCFVYYFWMKYFMFHNYTIKNFNYLITDSNKTIKLNELLQFEMIILSRSKCNFYHETFYEFSLKQKLEIDYIKIIMMILLPENKNKKWSQIYEIYKKNEM